MATTATGSLEQQQQQQQLQKHDHNQIRAASKTVQSSSTSSSHFNGSTSGRITVYDVEHLATFSTSGNHETNNGPAKNNNNDVDVDDDGDDNSFENNGCAVDQISSLEEPPILADKASNVTKTTPKIALQKLFELEKLSGIWTQRMQIELREDYMLIVDCETNSVVEKFDRDCVTKPEAFNQYNDIYNNIVVFIIQQQQQVASEQTSDPQSKKKNKKNSTNDKTRPTLRSHETEGELHIFQCVSHEALQLVSDILAWKSQTIRHSSDNNHQQQRHAGMAKSGADDKPASTSKKTASNDHHSSTTSSSSSSSSPPSRNGKTTSDQINATKNSPSPVAANGPSNGGGGKPVVTVASCASSSESVPIANVNVKETVQVFNQIAALREKSKPASPINHARPLSDASAASSNQTPANSEPSIPSPTSATNGASEAARMAASSPAGHFYKQRSIRATLAPKYATGNPRASPTNEHMAGSTAKPDSQNSRSNTSSSAASSSEAKSVAHNQQAAFSDRHPAGGAERNGYPQKQAAQMNVKMGGGSRTSSSQAHPSQSSAVPHNHHHHHHHSKSSKTNSQSTRTQQQRPQTESLRSRTSSSSQSQLDQVTTNESYVSVLNHCFDDIEKFIIRLQQAMAAARELQVKRKLSKRSSQANGASAAPGSAANNQLTAAELAMLTARARGPSEDDYFEILSKFKLAFNLLAKLKGCIHEPNAPELVHFLFTPLAIIIESARNASPPIDPTLVGIPYLNQDALDLLSNCCTSKESDMWISLGPNWTQTIDINLLRASRLPDSFQPIFSDGWAPIIGELELIGLVAPSASSTTGSTVNPALLAADCAISKINDSNAPNHHRHQYPAGRHPVPSYLSDESLATTSGLAGYSTLNEQPGYSTGSVSNGRLDKEKLHPTSRDMKKRNGPSVSAATSRLNNHDAFEPASQQQPYLSTVPYGFLHESGNPQDLHACRDDLLQASSHPQRLAGSSSHGRINKQGSRHQDYSSIAADHDTNYPATSLQQQPNLDTDSQLDVDLLAHQYDHGELHDHHVSEHNHLRGMPGPSSLHQYRKDKGHKHQQRGYQHQQVRNGRHSSSHPAYNHHSVGMHPVPPPLPSVETDFLNNIDQEAMILDLGLAQTEWLFELQSRGAMIVRVLFTRDANNDKELSVRRGELLEVLDDTRKWWRARNIDLQVAHVPHTIVAVMHGYKTLDELLANNQNEELTSMAQQRFSRRGMQPDSYDHQQWDDHHGDKQRNSKNAGAFRYF